MKGFTDWLADRFPAKAGPLKRVLTPEERADRSAYWKDYYKNVLKPKRQAQRAASR